MAQLKIAVASGKGGTGKTFFSTNLFFAIKDKYKTCLVDIDVEEPNSGLFIKENETIETEKAFNIIPEVDMEKCILCGKCSEYCEFNAIFVTPEKWILFPEICKGCTACIKLCPENALKYGKKEMGTISNNKNGFMEGRLKPKEPIAVPLIKKTKEKAIKNYDNADVIIFDSPPGTTCPTIAAMRGNDFIVVVGEPTPFGLNDFIITYEVLEKLNLKFGVVINRADIGNNEMKQFCLNKDIPILAEIPHNEEIAKNYSKGEPIVLKNENFRKYFVNAFETIKNLAGEI
jgi:MinD superfamily P-loop ATPase